METSSWRKTARQFSLHLRLFSRSRPDAPFVVRHNLNADCVDMAQCPLWSLSNVTQGSRASLARLRVDGASCESGTWQRPAEE